MDKLMMIVADVSKTDRKSVENMENERYTPNELSDLCTIHKLFCMPIQDFCESINDEELHIDSKWVSFCYVKL